MISCKESMALTGAHSFWSRNMPAWCHYRFNKQIMNNTRSYSNCRVLIYSKEYTSKACNGCGFLYPNIGGTECSDVHNAIKNPIEDSVELGILFINKNTSLVIGVDV